VQFLFGEPVNSGVLGEDPDFDVTDGAGDLVHNFDYRQIYSELLEHWFGLTQEDVTQLLSGRFTPLPLVRTATGAGTAPQVKDFTLGQNYPNPVSASVQSRIPFSLSATSSVELVLYDAQGSVVGGLANGVYPAGKHVVDVPSYGMPPGVYFYQLRVGGQKVTRKMMVR
jgi:hypothetical protein